MSLEIKKAVRQQRKARIDLTGPSGSGKTYTALKLATGMGKKILLIDSERKSASLYADDFDFDVIDLPDLSIRSYFAALDKAVGYDVLIIDSLSHAWDSVNEEVTNHAKRSNSGNSFKSWADKGNPLYNELLEKVLTAPCHVITTMRVKTDYVMEEYVGTDGKTRSKPKKIGLAPKFREGGEYEFDLVANMNLENELVVEKTRMSFLSGAIIQKPGAELGKKIADWLNSGSAPKKPTPAPAPSPRPDPIPENPWEWVLQGDIAFKGSRIADLEDKVIKDLKKEKKREELHLLGKLNGLDMEALYQCYKNMDALEIARGVEVMEEQSE